MKEKIKFSFSIEKEIWDKFKYIARQESRSNSKQLIQAIKIHIRNFEKKHGVINT